MSLQLTQLSIEDFSGGITDYILDAKPNQSAELQNFLIDPNKKLTTAPGTQIFDANLFQVPDGTVRVCSSFTSLMYNELLLNSGRRLWTPNGATWLELKGPTGNPAFQYGSEADFISLSEWNFHVIAASSSLSLPIKMYKDGSNVWQTRTAGLPELANAPTVVSSGGAGNAYIYAFLYHYTYTVGTTVFEDFGPTTLVRLANIGTPDANTVNISVMPVLANGTTLNYDTVAIKKYIYRSQSNGTVLYKCGEVANGVTVFADTMSDATLNTQLLLYTNSGVLDNDPPPVCKYVTTVNGITYYGYVVQDGETLKNRVRQSAQDDPDSCPKSNYIDLLDEVTGISSFNDNPIFFTKNHVYRINGTYSETGQGQVSYEDITKTIGCVSHNSIVQTRDGVFWAGNDGFYWTDGFQFKKISDSINERYKTIVGTPARASKIYGTYDTKDNRVYWAVSLDSAHTDNDSYIVLDLRWGIRPDSTFTTRTNDSNFSPTCITFFNKQLVHGDRRGYIFKHDTSYRTDPEINIFALPSLWSTVGIVPLYKSTVFNFGVPNVRKWVPKILLTLQNKSNVSVQIYGVNDNSSKQSALKEIRFRGDTVWGDPIPVWGVTELFWSFFNLIEEMRRFVAGSLRCSFKQIIITQSFTNIYNSDLYSTATVNGVAKTATLTGVTYALPAEIKNYYIAFDNDNYTKNYLITARNSNTQLTFLDTGGTAPTGVKKWLIRGQPKGELLDILSYIVYFAPLTDQSYKTWRKEQDSTGENV
jgi:hypothetical protein